MSELEFTRLNFRHDNLLHQMVHQDIDDAVLTLGISTAPAIGITVNVPVKHKIRDGRGRIAEWQSIGPIQQQRWFVREYLPRVILPFVQRGILIFELTKAKNIHCHMICWDPAVEVEIDMIELRAQINNCVLTQSICKGRTEHAKILNFVHFLADEPDWIDYLKKSQSSFKKRPDYFPFIWNHWSLESPLYEVSDLLISPEQLELAEHAAPAGLGLCEAGITLSEWSGANTMRSVYPTSVATGYPH